ncbi:hypothetical protein FB45DRAFT_943864 [Roridomyces roridus]|uniref:F-box domain-containing protein n=1 Tax=Roridomyces roridus TaxID=1738132 RepID=A0AAD7B3F4_9AGAR|nr:hypothetical protein FB45DRAFT_943864 [Roridomyces roridus]
MTMSIQDLEARIEELSSDIERQREILRKLEHDRSLVQRQLNAARDPVAQLPLEISSEIFLQCLPPQPIPEADQAPVLLLNVCTTWSDIALSTPVLWHKLCIPEELESLNAEAFMAGMERWLHRAGTHLLDITMERPLDSVVASLIRCYSSRLQRLDICVCSSGEEFENPNLFDITQLEPRLPFLRTLIFRPTPSDRYQGTFPAPPIFHLLRGAPELTELSVKALSVLDAADGIWTAEVVLPNLQRFEYGYEPPVAEGALKYLTAPRLEFLSLSTAEEPSVVTFLKRSSPPLREVIIDYGPPVSQTAFTEFLSHLPSVTRLKIGHLSGAAAESFFDILVETGSGALPSLQTLELYSMGDWSDWSLVLRALSARRSGLRSVNLSHFSRHLAVPWSLDAQFRGEFGQLVADGMEIYIQSEEAAWPDGNIVQLLPAF